MRANLKKRQGEILAMRKAFEDNKKLEEMDKFAHLNRHQRRMYAAIMRRMMKAGFKHVKKEAQPNEVPAL